MMIFGNKEKKPAQEGLQKKPSWFKKLLRATLWSGAAYYAGGLIDQAGVNAEYQQTKMDILSQSDCTGIDPGFHAHNGKRMEGRVLDVAYSSMIGGKLTWPTIPFVGRDSRPEVQVTNMLKTLKHNGYGICVAKMGDASVAVSTAKKQFYINPAVPAERLAYHFTAVAQFGAFNGVKPRQGNWLFVTSANDADRNIELQAYDLDKGTKKKKQSEKKHPILSV